MGILGISTFLEMVVFENRLACLFHMVPLTRGLPATCFELRVCLRGQIDLFFHVLQSGAAVCFCCFSQGGLGVPLAEECQAKFPGSY